MRAEAAGWDGVFLWDHVVTDTMPIAEPWTALSAIAQATRHLLLGPTITPLARRRPWVVARQASTVSRLSGGRLIPRHRPRLRRVWRLPSTSTRWSSLEIVDAGPPRL
jgi:hypothetical protein